MLYLAKFSSLCSFTLISNKHKVCKPNLEFSLILSNQLSGLQLFVKKGIETV